MTTVTRVQRQDLPRTFVGDGGSPETFAEAFAVSGATSSAPSGTPVNRSGTITLGATAQQAMAANASRRYLFVLNPDTETEDLGVYELGTATLTSPSIVLHPGDYWQPSFVPVGAISVIAATTAHVFIAREG